MLVTYHYVLSLMISLKITSLKLQSNILLLNVLLLNVRMLAMLVKWNSTYSIHLVTNEPLHLRS